MKFVDIIKQISEEFTVAWNCWDIDKLINHLADDATLSSPYVTKIYPLNSNNTLFGKTHIKEYWILLHERVNSFQVEQISIQKNDRVITTLNAIVGTSIIIKESFTVNEYGKIGNLHYEYFDPSLT